jgi:hypothetical protein
MGGARLLLPGCGAYQVGDMTIYPGLERRDGQPCPEGLLVQFGRGVI